jgi:hypothetical protein
MPDPDAPRDHNGIKQLIMLLDLENRSRPCDELGTKPPLRFSDMCWCLLFLKIVADEWSRKVVKYKFDPSDFLLWICLVLSAFSSFTLPILIGKHLLVWLTLTPNYPLYCIFLFLKGCALCAFICHYYAFSAHKVVVPVSIPLIWTHGKPKGWYHSTACRGKRYLTYLLT